MNLNEQQQLLNDYLRKRPDATVKDFAELIKRIEILRDEKAVTNLPGGTRN
jgi:hypothetical protein